MPFTMTRFGQGRLSTHSSSVSPPSTPDSTKVTATYVKKPYLGWRSQEKLNAANAAAGAPSASGGGPPKLSIYLPPAERLAADLLAARAKSPVRPPVSDRPPLPKAPPRSDKNLATKPPPHPVSNDVTEDPRRSVSPVIAQQKSSVAVVTKLSPVQDIVERPVPPPQTKSSKPTKVAADVHDSIRQVTSAISHYVNRGNETSSGQPKPGKSKTGKKQAIWIESSFVGQKPPNN